MVCADTFGCLVCSRPGVSLQVCKCVCVCVCVCAFDLGKTGVSCWSCFSFFPLAALFHHVVQGQDSSWHVLIQDFLRLEFLSNLLRVIRPREQLRELYGWTDRRWKSLGDISIRMDSQTENRFGGQRVLDRRGLHQVK